MDEGDVGEIPRGRESVTESVSGLWSAVLRVNIGSETGD